MEVGAKSIKILEKVFFESGSGVILDKSFPLLDEIATTLIELGVDVNEQQPATGQLSQKLSARLAMSKPALD